MTVNRQAAGSEGFSFSFGSGFGFMATLAQGKGQGRSCDFELVSVGGTLRYCSNWPPTARPMKFMGQLGARDALVQPLPESCQRLCIQNAVAIISNANALLCTRGKWWTEGGEGSACTKGVAMAKHVMNCLFGHSINFRLYDAAAA